MLQSLEAVQSAIVLQRTEHHIFVRRQVPQAVGDVSMIMWKFIINMFRQEMNNSLSEYDRED